MDFIKRHWSTLILISAIAVYLGVSMGSDQCPLCVASNFVFGTEEATGRSTDKTSVIGEDEAPTWQVQTLQGNEINSSTSKGKVSVLVYWATWCAPCIEEIPTLISLRNEFPNSELEIIGVSLDEASKGIEKFVKAHKVNYTIARNNQSLDAAFGPIRYIPTIVILDQDGKVQQRHTGLVGHDVIRGQIESLLANET